MIGTMLLFLPGEWNRRFLDLISFNKKHVTSTGWDPQRHRLIKTLFLTYFIIQLLVPLRHFLIPGNVDWTNEAHNFSWRMKLVDKRGKLMFYVAHRSNPEPEMWHHFELHINRKQYQKMTTHPDMILQFSHYIAGLYSKRGYKEVKVYAASEMSLNGREYQFLINPNLDLTREKLTFGHAGYITEFKGYGQK
jgi:hypothetical protein